MLRLIGDKTVVGRRPATRTANLGVGLAVHSQVQDGAELVKDLAQILLGSRMRQITQEQLVYVIIEAALRASPVL